MHSQIQALSNTEFGNCNVIYTNLLKEAFKSLIHGQINLTHFLNQKL